MLRSNLVHALRYDLEVPALNLVGCKRFRWINIKEHHFHYNYPTRFVLGRRNKVMVIWT